MPWERISRTVCDIVRMQVQLRQCMRGGAREGGRGREEGKEAGCMNACMNACMRKTVLCMKACIGNNPLFCRGKIGEVYSCDISCAWTLFLMRQFMRHLMRHSCGIDATSQAPGEFLFMRYSCGIHAEFMRHSCDISSARGILFMRGLMRDLPHGIREAKRLSERSHPPCA